MWFPFLHDHPDVDGMECVGCFGYWLAPTVLLVLTIVMSTLVFMAVSNVNL